MKPLKVSLTKVTDVLRYLMFSMLFHCTSRMFCLSVRFFSGRFTHKIKTRKSIGPAKLGIIREHQKLFSVFFFFLLEFVEMHVVDMIVHRNTTTFDIEKKRAHYSSRTEKLSFLHSWIKSNHLFQGLQSGILDNSGNLFPYL